MTGSFSIGALRIVFDIRDGASNLAIFGATLAGVFLAIAILTIANRILNRN